MNRNKPQPRSLTFERAELDVEARTVPISVSSDSKEILRYVPGFGVGYEVLDHSDWSAINLTRFAGDNGGPMLWAHDQTQPIGRFVPTEIAGGKLRGIARFGRNPKADEVFRDIQDGIITDTSILPWYDPEDVVQEGVASDGYPIFRVRRWELMEASMVSVPADVRTGVGRSAQPDPPVSTTTEDISVETTTQAAPRSAQHTEVRMDPNTLAAETASNPIAEAMQLRSIAETHGKGREAAEILASLPLTEARAKVMQLLATTPLPAGPKSLQEMGASERELKDFSYSRLLSAAIEQREGRAVNNCHELEVSQTIGKSMPATYKQRSGVFAPFQLRAAMDSKTATAGKELVFTQPGELIDILRSKLFLTKLGARFLTGLTSPIGFSKQTGAAIANWIDENGGADAAESAAATGIVTLSPKTLIGVAKISRQLLTLGSWDAELMVRQDLAYSHAAALELASIHGTGGTQPTGIYNLSGVNAVAMGGNPTYAKAVDMLTEIAVDNALGGQIGWVTTPRVAGKLKQTLEFAAAGSQAAWTGTYEDGFLAGYKATSSNLIKSNLGAGTNEHGMVTGDWSSMIVGMFGNGFELIPDHITLAAQGLVKVNSFGMADVVTRYAESFAKATGVVIS